MADEPSGIEFTVHPEARLSVPWRVPPKACTCGLFDYELTRIKSEDANRVCFEWRCTCGKKRVVYEHAGDNQASVFQEALDEIAKLCGCPAWDYAGQVVRDVKMLREAALTLAKNIFEASGNNEDAKRVLDLIKANPTTETEGP